MKVLKSENDVKDVVKGWYADRNAWHYAPIQNGMGVHGIPDRIGCIPTVVTQAMVGKTVGLFVAVEAKKPGRRDEPNRGMTVHQVDHQTGITKAAGLAICCDGQADLDGLHNQLMALMFKAA